MYKNILLPTDGSELCQKAIESGVNLAKALNAKITGVYVMPKLSSLDILGDYDPEEIYGPKEGEKAKQSFAHIEELNKSLADKYFSVIEKMAKEAGVSCENVYVTGKSPADGIIKVANEKGCDLIVMSSHGRSGIRGVLLGNVTAKVLAHSKMPVLVHRC